VCQGVELAGAEVRPHVLGLRALARRLCRRTPDLRAPGDLHLASQVLGGGPPDVLLLDQGKSSVLSRQRQPEKDRPPLVVTADQQLRERLTALGARVIGPGTLWERLDGGS
jgi:hypothetical protein